MAKCIMVQGTTSDAGKSLLTAALCRIFAQDGLKTAPFKAQNMARNSYITDKYLEIARSVAMQAWSAKTIPDARMNPILLKPLGNNGSEVFVLGKKWGTMTAQEYYRAKLDFLPVVEQAYRELSNEYDVIVLEGAGSPAEINLRQYDLVNMGMAKMANAPVILVADIDRGGVFASLVGTVELLNKNERNYIKGTIINKFRGDRELLLPGIGMLEEKIGYPNLGILPYLSIDLEPEDSLSESFSSKENGQLSIGIIHYPYIANAAEFYPLSIRPEVSLEFVVQPNMFQKFDLLILPASVSPDKDLCWLNDSGFFPFLKKYVEQNGELLALGESTAFLGNSMCFGKHRIAGLGLDDMEYIVENVEATHSTEWLVNYGSLFQTFDKEQDLISTCRIVPAPTKLENYTTLPFRQVFDNEEITEYLIMALLQKKDAYSIARPMYNIQYREQQYEYLANECRKYLNMDMIYSILDTGV